MIWLMYFLRSVNYNYYCTMSMVCYHRQMAKLLVYIRYSTMANVMFAIFSLIFAVTRLVVLPNWLANSHSGRPIFNHYCRVLPSLLYDLPQHAGHHSYITGAAIALILALMVYRPLYSVYSRMSSYTTHAVSAHLLVQSHCQSSSAAGG